MKLNSLSKHRIKKIINCFAAELTAIDTAQKLKIHRNTVNKYYRFIREAVAQYQEVQYLISSSTHAQDIYLLAWHRNTGLTLTPSNEATNYNLLVAEGKIYIRQQQADNPSPIVLAEHQVGNLTTTPQNIAQYFYNYAKTRLTKFYGIRTQYADLYIKELAFRFNNQDSNLAALIWKIISQADKQQLETNNSAAQLSVSLDHKK